MINKESILQQNCVKWFRLQHPKLTNLLFSVPNGGQRNYVTAAILKAEGTVSGVADLILLVPSPSIGYFGLCIEMKSGKNKQTENQKSWQGEVEKQGYKYVVCRSIDEFMNTINDYLK